MIEVLDGNGINKTQKTKSKNPDLKITDSELANLIDLVKKGWNIPKDHDIYDYIKDAQTITGKSIKNIISPEDRLAIGFYTKVGGNITNTYLRKGEVVSDMGWQYRKNQAATLSKTISKSLQKLPNYKKQHIDICRLVV